MAAEKKLSKWSTHGSNHSPNPQKTAENFPKKNLPRNNYKYTPSKQGVDNLTLLPGTNPHSKTDGSTTSVVKSLLNTPKETEKGPGAITYSKPKKTPQKIGKRHYKILSGTNPHPKADKSTTQITKSSL